MRTLNEESAMANIPAQTFVLFHMSKLIEIDGSRREGGTHVKASPCFDFLRRTWSGYLKALGVNIDLTLDRAGFYPRGGGMIHARIESTPTVRPFHGMTTPIVTKATIVAGVAGLPAH